MPHSSPRVRKCLSRIQLVRILLVTAFHSLRHTDIASSRARGPAVLLAHNFVRCSATRAPYLCTTYSVARLFLVLYSNARSVVDYSIPSLLYRGCMNMFSHEI